MKTETARHAPGALKVAEIILGECTTITTTWGKKTKEGIADLIERESEAVLDCWDANEEPGDIVAAMASPDNAPEEWITKAERLRAAIAAAKGAADERACRVAPAKVGRAV